jgi:transcription termination factor Rho
MTATTQESAAPAQLKQVVSAISVSGIVDVADGHAFVRISGYRRSPDDVYVSAGQIGQYGLRKGDRIEGTARPDGARTNETRTNETRTNETGRGKFRPLLRVDTVNGMPPELARARPRFDDLTPLYPQQRLRLEDGDPSATARIIDLVAPIGKGQRGLIVSPPKAGKTMVLQAIAAAIANSHPEVELMVVLVGERPEEVTDLRRSVRGEVIFSTFDQAATDHIRVAELAIERAKRLVEMGADVVVLLDSITRLGRAYNLAAPASSRTLAGGVAASALQPPRQFLGAARNVEDGGSLTIVSTALVDTGSRLDDVLFEEFKGTGNMELRLRRELAEKRIFPAIDAMPSGTRREELLMTPDEYQAVGTLRRALGALDSQQALELLLAKTRDTASNPEFLRQVQRSRPAA